MNTSPGAGPARTIGGEAVARLPPNAFAAVMATGMISAALDEAGAQVFAAVFLAIAVTVFIVLFGLAIAHATHHPARVAADARNPRAAFGYFTLVAALAVLATRFVTVGLWDVAAIVAALAAVCWLFFVYALPANLILRPHAEPVSADIDGSWFLWVVSTQALSIAIGAIDRDDAVEPLVVSLWSVGIVLYLILATLILLRLLTVPNTPDSFSPSYWIFTGATAISVLAGARILETPATSPVIGATGEFVSGGTFVLWAFGTWWVPLLVIFGVWRHIVKRRPFSYEAGLWSMVFPLGTYAAASMAAGDVLALSWMSAIGRVVAVVAVVAWLIVAFLGLAAAFRRIRSPLGEGTTSKS
jgi:tellurite resistance protein TehA-like permease